ncbi:MAG: hypothetical protein RMJ98_22560, partial [Myxococcales bacterium]|nr:hypothetical protein [Polyangiaceae bacterium]MDW8252087.1 hypothetical protein [Myxococcales bacterium]
MRWPVLLFSVVTAGCAGLLGGEVPRKVHGRVYVGPFVSEEAYAAFLEGTLAERRGDLAQAEEAYLRSASQDRRHPDPWVRIAALRCTQGDRPGSDGAFARAARLDPEFGPLLREQARCAEARGESAQAREFALRAVAADPSDSEPPLLLAQLALASGDAA